jgi:predicted DNA-binding transcriptional regulator YafY
MERILVRAYQNERYYLRDLPMHHSQKLMNEGEDYADYEYNLCPTLDFFGYLLSRGSYIKVLEPQWVADKIRNMHLEALKRYEDEENV